MFYFFVFFFFFQAEDGIRDLYVTGVQTCALPIYVSSDRDAALSELTLAVNVARTCARWLAPIVPRFARGVEEQSGAKLRWGDFTPLENAPIREPRPLVRKVEDADVQKLASQFVAADPAPAANVVVT